jgi:hypothetical protein
MQMLLESLKKKNMIEKIILLFILVQPLLDLATSLAINYLESEFTVGILIRFAMMAVGVGYLFFISDSKSKRTSIIYLIILGLFLILGLINNIMVKSPLSVGEEIKFIIKAVYFVALFFSYLFVFKKIQSQKTWTTTIQAYIVYAMTIVGFTMLIASVTNSAFSSYTYNKVGHSGWFYAGNELSAIMSICFPIVVLFAVKKTTSFKAAIYWVPTLLLIYSLMAVGTKVGFGAVLITLVISFIMITFELVARKKEEKQQLKNNLIINVIVLVLFALYIPFSPIAENTSIHLSLLENEEDTNDQIEKQPNNTGKHDTGKQNLNDEQLENLMLSGRGAFLEQHKEYFSKAPLSQKLLGMGYAGNYEDYPKMIEMDLHDLFFSFGILGFVLYFIPFILIAILIIKKILFNFKSQFTIENVLIASGIVLGLGIAFTAGHVFTAPAVSIYLAILVAYLYITVVKPS